MSIGLPPRARHRLEQALAQHPHWRCHPALAQPPRAVALLAPGFSNFSVLVEGAGQRFVVRIDGVDATAHGINRQAEWAALETAHRAGIAPQPRYFNPDIGCLVCDYLPPDTGAAPDDAATGRLLRAIHALPPRRHRLHLPERILRYEHMLARPALAPPLAACREPVAALLRDVGADTTAPALCHNDLLRGNRVSSGGRLWALDWEYCAMGSPWYDIAVVLEGDELAPAARETLLRAYLGRRARVAERRLLARYGAIYRYLELLWHLALARPALSTAGLDAKLAGLRAALAAAG